MKQIVSLILVLGFIVACHSSKKAVAEKKSTLDKKEYENGLQLIASNDCYTCHKIDSRLIGPSFNEIAAKYKEQSEAVSKLGAKIIKGGSGVWGKVPMVPHSDMSVSQAEIIAGYILTITK